MEVVFASDRNLLLTCSPSRERCNGKVLGLIDVPTYKKGWLGTGGIGIGIVMILRIL